MHFVSLNSGTRAPSVKCSLKHDGAIRFWKLQHDNIQNLKKRKTGGEPQRHLWHYYEAPKEGVRTSTVHQDSQPINTYGNWHEDVGSEDMPELWMDRISRLWVEGVVLDQQTASSATGAGIGIHGEVGIDVEIEDGAVRPEINEVIFINDPLKSA